MEKARLNSTRNDFLRIFTPNPLSSFPFIPVVTFCAYEELLKAA
jgi:hypothetical protein